MMKKTALLLILLTFSISLSAQSEEKTVQNVVNTAYVGGIHNGGPIADIEKGFHENFKMHVLRDDNVSEVTIGNWVANIKKRRARPDYDNDAFPKSKAEFIKTSVNGNSAFVELNLMREGKKVFTDYLALYKFSDGWKIVSKTFYRWP